MTLPRPRAATRETAIAVSESLALLHDKVDALTALMVQVVELRRPNGRPRDCDIWLVRCISRLVEEARFSTKDVIKRASFSDADELREALLAATDSAVNAKKLGRRLKHLEDIDLDGLRVLRDGN